MIDVKQLIRNKFSNYENSKVMIKAKELYNILSKEEIDLIYQYFKNILKICDKTDCVKQAIRFELNGFNELGK